LVLPANLNPMPADYGTKIKQFGGEDDYTVRKHIQWFKYFCELNEIDHEDVQMRLFAQSLRDNVKEWFRGLAAASINTIEGFFALFRDRWEEKKNSVQMLTSYNQLKRGHDESIKNFSFRFNTVYNSLPIDCKPPEGMAKLHYAEAFDDEFALFLRERRSPTLAQMMSDAVEVEINMMSSKRGRYRAYPREQKKPKEESRASTSSDPKFDSLMKVMEKLVDKLSIRDKPPARDNVPQVRNPNYRGPRQQDPNPPRIIQRGEKIPNDPNRENNDQVRPPFQQNLVDEEFLNEEHEEINSVGGEDERYFLTKKQHDDYLKGLQVNIEDYQQGYQSGMISL
jgi:hypothetical protein